MTTFSVSLVARTPQASGPPTLVEVDRLVVNTISYVEELNRSGTANLACPVRSLSEANKVRLANLRAFPCEAWVYQESAVVWAGEIQSAQVQGQTLTLTCVGLLAYLNRMGVTADLLYPGIDQFVIGKGLVDSWQSKSYAHFGIDTSTIGTSGVLRDRSYLRNELHNVGQRVTELGAVIDGFDIRVDPATRKLVFAFPKQGIDLSATVILDQRNIDSSSIAFSVAPDDVVSDYASTSTTQDPETNENITIFSYRATASVQTSYGRSWSSGTEQGVSVQATLDGAGDAFLAPRKDVLFQPGVTIVPRLGSQIGSFHAGDTVAYSYDAGLGLQSGNFRVAKLTVSVTDEGKQRMGVEFV